MTDFEAFLGCENFRPLYTTAAHEALCYNGTESFLWLAISQAAIVVCSLIVFSAQSAFYEKSLQDCILQDRDDEDLLLEEESGADGKKLPSSENVIEEETSAPAEGNSNSER